MATLTVRNLNDDLVRRLRIRAAEHGRSAEAEHREILRLVLVGNGDRGRTSDYCRSSGGVPTAVGRARFAVGGRTSSEVSHRPNNGADRAA